MAKMKVTSFNYDEKTGKMVIEAQGAPSAKAAPSKSGKNRNLFTTAGASTVGELKDGSPITANLNIYAPAAEKGRSKANGKAASSKGKKAQADDDDDDDEDEE